MRTNLAASFAFSIASLVVRGAMADTVVVTPDRDDSMFSESGSLSNGQGSGLYTGLTNDGYVRRAVLHFDVAGAIPPGSTITDAALHLYVTTTNTGDLPIALHALTADWGEGTSVASTSGGGGGAPATAFDATWTYRFYDTTPWASPGGDFDATASASATAGATDTTSTWASARLTADVQAWFAAPASNHGYIAIAQTSGTGQAKRFASREYADATRWPALEITFTPPAPSGACCLADGSCTTVLDPGGACAGTYEGAGTDCTTTSCPQPTGACCFADAAATCTTLTAVDCTASSGVFAGVGVGCPSAACPVVLTPFLDPMPLLPVAEPVAGTAGGEASYEMRIVQLEQTLHRELPPTTVWGFDDGTHGPQFPGPTIEARQGAPIDVRWVNDLRDASGDPRTTHFLAVDPCPHGASDEPRSVIHLHGGHVPAAFDGYPEASLLPGQQAVYSYPDAQPAATLWYHDHSLGITRLNVEMGLAGAYILRDDEEDALSLPSGPYDVAMMFQDRRFRADGSFDYPAAFQEHVFGDTALVNGRAWPYFVVARAKYRLRWLNASGSRTYRFSLSNGAPFVQIGSDGGLLESPVDTGAVLLMPGERADVVVDFSSYPEGTEIDLVNDAPAPYPGTMSMAPLPRILRFVVSADAGPAAPLPASLAALDLPNEAESVVARDFELRRETDDCTGAAFRINGLMWDDVTERPRLGTTEIWRFINRSGVAHPMHLHLVQFRVLDRQPFVEEGDEIVPSGPAVPPEPAERGYKDTVRVEPLEIVRVAARFEHYTGRFAYHCHVLEHEDMEMMRQFEATTECGDGVLGVPDEACDDGNVVDGDGCSAACEIEDPGVGGGGASGGGGPGGSSAEGGTRGNDDDAGDNDDAGGNDGGCDCALAGVPSTSPGLLGMLGLVAVTLLRRRASSAGACAPPRAPR